MYDLIKESVLRNFIFMTQFLLGINFFSCYYKFIGYRKLTSFNRLSLLVYFFITFVIIIKMVHVYWYRPNHEKRDIEKINRNAFIQIILKRIYN